MPEQQIQRYIDFLQGLRPITAAALIALGAVFMGMGWKSFKILVTADALALGIILGSTIGARINRPNMDVFLGIGGGLIFAALAWPLMKGAVSLLAALAGAFVGYFLWRYAAHTGGYHAMADHAWAGALIGLVSMSLLAFIIFRTSVIIVMAMQGAAMLVSGTFALMFRIEGMRLPVQERLTDNVFFLPVAGLVAGILAIIYQESKFIKFQTRKRKAAMQRSS